MMQVARHKNGVKLSASLLGGTALIVRVKPRIFLAILLSAVLEGCADPGAATVTITRQSMAQREAARLGAPTVDASLQCGEYLTKPVVPPYPPPALRHEVEGWVLLQYGLDGTSHAIDIVVVSSKPKDVFDRSAIDALKQTEFRFSVIKPTCQMLVTFGLH
jgi:TonB family protein